MGRNRLVDLIGKLSGEQVGRLSGIAMEYLELNTEFENTTPKSYPCCGDANAHFNKRRFSGQKQRYQCKSCGKRFTFDAGKLTVYSHIRRKKLGQPSFVPSAKRFFDILMVRSRIFNLHQNNKSGRYLLMKYRP